MMSGVEHRIELPWIQSEYEVRDGQILLAAAFVCRNDKHPTELLEMLGLTDDLSRVRDIRRSRLTGKEAPQDGRM